MKTKLAVAAVLGASLLSAPVFAGVMCPGANDIERALCKEMGGSVNRSRAIPQAPPAGSPDAAIAALRLQSPNASDYEILKGLFENAKDPVAWGDVDRSGKRCVVAFAGTRGWIKEVSLFHLQARRTRVSAVPAHPAQGPLVPASPGLPAEVDVKDLALWDERGGGLYTPGAFDGEYFDAVTAESSGAELHSTSDIGAVFKECTVRKNGRFLAFANHWELAIAKHEDDFFKRPGSDPAERDRWYREKAEAGFSLEYISYGYCW